ncbi:MAG: NADH-quinone oxidoreductase subunit NuoK [Chloroflexota bacterium]|jgi:NADH-quinone oxidoreductase subunit K|nr:NADH-quinone oxidoreductase subunit NuoK [Chloroflexia bacterium]MDQ3444327.1 NADH-quinone oxidoreductase subunit NuoK [Chloroflexota bacterium]MDQ3653901.1 NADH-quinone oxidoreductase subunit NuoK [Chloroflexota bacterium]
MGELTVEHFLFLSAALFIIGMMGVLTRRNMLIILMCIELMVAAVSISFVAFAWESNTLGGQIFVLFALAVAAAEAAVGLGIILALSRRGKSVDVDDLRSLRD